MYLIGCGEARVENFSFPVQTKGTGVTSFHKGGILNVVEPRSTGDTQPTPNAASGSMDE